MKTSKRAVNMAGAFIVAAGLCAPWAAGAAPFATGGTITFSGAIVAPSYGIATSLSEYSQGFHTEKSGNQNASTVDVTFTPARNTSPSAQVALLVNTDAGIAAPRTLKTRFTDNATRGAQGTGAAFSLGRAGGTLSIAGGTAAERAVTVVVSYD